MGFIAGVTKDLTAKVHAGKLIQALAKRWAVGGGRPDLAEPKRHSRAKNALLGVPRVVEALL